MKKLPQKTMESEIEAISPVEQRLPLSQYLALGFQHTIIAILAAIPVPLIISANADLSVEETRFFVSAVILTAGLSSILASVNVIPGTSPLIPMVMGANFAVIPVVVATLNGASTVGHGFQLIAGATILSGVLCFFLAPFWAKLQRFFPPIVVGTNLMVLGTALLPNAFHWMMGERAYDLTQSIEPKSLFLALAIFIFHIIISKYLSGMLGNLTILIALAVGTLAALMLNMMDVSVIRETPWFGVVLPFRYGIPSFDLTTMFSFFIVMILGMVEVSGTSMGIHNIVEKKNDRRQLTRTLKTLGIGTLLSGSFNSVQPTAFVQNLGLLDLTKIGSRFVISAAGIMIALIGFVPKFSAFISAIPKPVLGGVGLAIFGVIIGSAVNVLKNVEFQGNQNMLIIGLSVGVGMLPAIYPNFYGEFPQLVQNIFGSGILSGAIMAITLNMFFNSKEVFGKKTIE